jgi:dienelactone hydrolase
LYRSQQRPTTAKFASRTIKNHYRGLLRRPIALVRSLMRSENKSRTRICNTRTVVETAVVMVFLAVMLCSAQLRAQMIEERRAFEVAPRLTDIAAPAEANERRDVTAAANQMLEGYLSKPSGNGPFPAVVYLHACGGLDPVTRQRFSKIVTESGYVFFAIDSFITRAITEACDHPMPDRRSDALGALEYLAKLPFVDPTHMAVVGSSQGAIVALNLALTDSSNSFDGRNRSRIKAVVAFYPLCGTDSKQLAVPTLILIGELDDWAPAKDCQQWIGRHGPGITSVKLVVYPGAYHAFDFPQFADAVFAFGHRMKYDKDATQRATDEMRQFLALYLLN